MSKIDLLGWLAAAMVLVTFYLTTMTPLRVVAIASNVLFIFFGLLSQTLPIMVLHCLLLPLNIWRLVEVQQKRKWARSTSISHLSQTVLLPFMKKGHAARGTRLFSKGDGADQVYLLLSGEVRLRHANNLVQPGQLLGLIGVFSPDNRRTDTAECTTEVEFAVITAPRFWEIVDHHPHVGNDLLRTLVRRHLDAQEANGFRSPGSPVGPASDHNPLPASRGLT